MSEEVEEFMRLADAKGIYVGSEQRQKVLREMAPAFLSYTRNNPRKAVASLAKFVTNIDERFLSSIDLQSESTTTMNIYSNVMVPLKCRIDGMLGLYLDFSIFDAEQVEDEDAITELFCLNLLAMLINYHDQSQKFYLLIDCCDASYTNIWPMVLNECLTLTFECFPIKVGAIYIYMPSLVIKSAFFTMSYISSYRSTLVKMLNYVADQDELVDLVDKVELLPGDLGGQLRNTDPLMKNWPTELISAIKAFITGERNVRTSVRNGVKVDVTLLKKKEQMERKLHVSEHSPYLDLGTRPFHEQVRDFQDNPEVLRAEFDGIKFKEANPEMCKASAGHRVQNREQNNCLDDTRVVIETGTDDYINANYVNGLNKVKEFIIAQAPLESTLEQFMRMIWEKKIRVVICLTRLSMQDVSKTEVYWPESLDGQLEFGPFVLKATAIEGKSVVRTTISMENLLEPDETREFTHFRLIDEVYNQAGIPKYGSFNSLMHQTEGEQYQSKHEEPVLVHCSSGTRMSAVFVVLKISKILAKAKRNFELAQIVEVMRTQRGKCIKQFAEYKFMAYCLTESLVHARILDSSVLDYLKKHYKM